MKEKIRELFYPGKIKGFRVDFERENARSMCFMLVVGLVVSVIGFVYEMSFGGFPTGTRTLEYVLFFCISVALLVGYRKEMIKHGTAALYIWVSLFLLWSLLLCAGDKMEYPTYLFMFLILVLPLLIRDSWGNIVILVVSFSVAFIIIDKIVKRTDFFALDMLHLALCVAAALFLTQRLIQERITFMEHTATASAQADHDVLTGIYNRRGGENLIHSYIVNGVTGAFMLIDIDDFKHINDNYGHAMGDEVLQKIAVCLRQNFRETDVVMRMGGDEFIVYALGMADIRHVEDRLSKLKDSLHKITFAAGSSDHVTASIGCIVNLGSYPDYESLSSAADNLLYLVKEEGKDNFKCSGVEYKGRDAQAERS